MTLLRDREQATLPQRPTLPPVSTATEASFGLVGVLVAAFGAVMYYFPSNVLWFWDTSAFAIGWSLSLLIVGGLVTAAAAGIAAVKRHREHAMMTPGAYGYGTLGFAGLAIACVYALVWIL